MRAIWLSLTLLFLLAIGILHWRYRRSGAERERFDLRALAEGLRVQIAWSLAGLPNAVAADYMQRQRGELDWIRRAIQVASIPIEPWPRAFRCLSVQEQSDLMERTRRFWVAEQHRYFRNAASKAAANHRRFRLWGWSIAAAALLNVIAKWLCVLSERAHQCVEQEPIRLCATSFLLGVALVLLGGFLNWRRRQMQPVEADEEDHRPHSLLRWLLGRPILWGMALIFAVLPFGLPRVLTSVVWPGPSLHGWWMILTGVTLAFGLLWLAWTERSFHAEDARRYRAMAHLFDCADRRLGSFETVGAGAALGLIEQYRRSGDPRALEEIHDILYQLGQDALDENAEWLILRRTHPLEPFMAG
jgi:hypothetical protein